MGHIATCARCGEREAWNVLDGEPVCRVCLEAEDAKLSSLTGALETFLVEDKLTEAEKAAIAELEASGEDFVFIPASHIPLDMATTIVETLRAALAPLVPDLALYPIVPKRLRRNAARAEAKAAEEAKRLAAETSLARTKVDRFPTTLVAPVQEIIRDANEARRGDFHARREYRDYVSACCQAGDGYLVTLF